MTSDLPARIATLTSEGAELAPKLSDQDLATWIEHHTRLLDAAVTEANRRKGMQK